MEKRGRRGRARKLKHVQRTVEIATDRTTFALPTLTIVQYMAYFPFEPNWICSNPAYSSKQARRHRHRRMRKTQCHETFIPYSH